MLFCLNVISFLIGCVVVIFLISLSFVIFPDLTLLFHRRSSVPSLLHPVDPLAIGKVFVIFLFPDCFCLLVRWFSCLAGSSRMMARPRDLFALESLPWGDGNITSVSGSVRYGLKNPHHWSPVCHGLVPLYDVTGHLGLLDPGNMQWYRRLRSDGGLLCAYDSFNDPHPVTEPRCHASPERPGHVRQCCLAEMDLLELRFSLALRSLAVALRCVVVLEELNIFAQFVHNRIYPGGPLFVPFPDIPDYFIECLRTGLLFPGEDTLIPLRHRASGMLPFPLNFGPSLLKFISHVEWIHFRLLDHLFRTPISLDCPTVVDELFPPWGVAYEYDGQTDQLRK